MGVILSMSPDFFYLLLVSSLQYFCTQQEAALTPVPLSSAYVVMHLWNVSSVFLAFLTMLPQAASPLIHKNSLDAAGILCVLLDRCAFDPEA